MVWITLLGWLVVVICIVVLVAIFMSDADLTLSYYARFGKNHGESLKNQVVWITGASSGIGEELAYQLAQIGCKLVLSARRKSELERVKNKCLERGWSNDDDIMVLPLDMCVFDSHGSATQKVIDKFKQIDILINNAGRSQRALAVETSLQVDKESLNVNVLGPVSLTKAVLPHMVARKSGHIVVNSSVAGKLAAPLQSAYSCAKFAVHGFFDVLRTEVDSDNIAVTTICPGPVVSNVVQNAMTTSVGVTAKEVGIDAALTQPNLMSTERCVKLIIIGMANRLSELWISKHPVLLFAYMSVYMPTCSMYLRKYYAKRRISNMKNVLAEKKTQ